jgi:hypothetical protein
MRVLMRHYFSTYLLWGSEDCALRAGAIEARHSSTDRSRFDIEHHALVLTAILSAANFLEAMINELYQDAHDDHGISGDGYIAPLPAETRTALAALWAGTAEGSKLSSLEKYQLLMISAGRKPLDRGAQPYQDAALVVRLRNTIAHYQPRSVGAYESSPLEDQLRGKFPENRLMAGSGNAWWPSHALGHGCATWAWKSALALADAVVDAVGVTPNYRRHRPDGWTSLGQPGASAMG